ncbi:MAG: hypothetical protein IKE15_06015 [Clostridia bacterium]|nr:hypothetical protein [Clostridia bacterium]
MKEQMDNYMYIEPKPFPYLNIGQYADLGNGDIIFLDDAIKESDREELKKQYKKWWDERQSEKAKDGYV